MVQVFFNFSIFTEILIISIFKIYGVVLPSYLLKNILDKVFKNGPSKICGRQPLKNLKGYGLLEQLIAVSREL